MAVRAGGLTAIIDTRLHMECFEKAVDLGLIPWLSGWRIARRNAPLGSSRIDYLVCRDSERMYVELKSAVAFENGYASYPDCPSPRGRRHIRELISYSESGGRSAIVFVAGVSGVRGFRPSKSDPEIRLLLARAVAVGVMVRAISIELREDGVICLANPDLPVVLQEG